MIISRLPTGDIDLENLRTNANWNTLTEMEKLLLTFQQWNWERLIEEVKIDPSLARLRWGYGENLLCIAAHDNQFTLTKLLLDCGADVKSVNDFGTALYCAVWGGNLDIVQLLLDKGASPSGRGEHGETPLQLAVRKGYSDIVNVLLASGADMSVIDETTHNSR